MNGIHVKPELVQVLSALKGDNFTVAELTQAYLNHPNSKHQSAKAARQFVYRNMVRMIKLDLMERLPESEGWPRYRLSDKFTTNAPATTEPPQSLPAPAKQPAKTVASSSILKERLSKHRSDMLCAMGEAEEYNALCTEFPELSEAAQTLYNDARERSAILLGKIKALESLLSKQPT